MAETRGREVPEPNEAIDRFRQLGVNAYALGYATSCIWMAKLYLETKNYKKAMKCLNDAEDKLKEIEL